jgi:hypothetical protein
MTEIKDIWHVRLPDGRVLRAAARAVRNHHAAGRLPAGAEVRRRSSDEWRPLAAHPEFTEKADTGSWNDISLDQAGKAVTVASRMDAAQLRQPGVRGLLEELHAALDNTLTSRKIVATGFVALIAAAGAAAALLANNLWATLGCIAGVGLVGLGLMALLSRMTFIEASRMRPSRIRDGWEGFAGLLPKLVFTWGVALAALGAMSWGLRQLPGVVPAEWGPWATAGVMFGAGVVECLVWPLIVFLGPLAAIWVVEECSFGTGLGLWMQMLGPIRWRFFVSQWLTLSMAGVAALPLGWVVGQSPAGPALAWAVGGTLVLSFYSVANVLLYLHLKYEER